ncbi:hypothetical protein Q0V21_31200 [Paenibacillus sp. 11B]|uniref:hypothetical protein n=1 Tax=Paenibacillus sp. 11B TaxID=3060965 RepID=UPI0026531CF8|nr:hypothetical protein [Paenibacillus sp. 11B]MDN8593199.1 hypothetical protein [Paenibacillus sp. 11B]
MPRCIYCREEMETMEYLETESGFTSAEVCVNENCVIHNIVNLYFKEWKLTKEEIEARLNKMDVSWNWMGKFFVLVDPINHYKVRAKLVTLNLENGAMLLDSTIDYVSIPVL